MRHLTGDADVFHEPLNPNWREEIDLVSAACKRQPHDIRLLWEWLSDPGVLARADELIAKEATCTARAVLLMREAADNIVALVAKGGAA